MRTAAECRQCAEECRSLLTKELTEDQRRLVLAMAEIWEDLAHQRECRSQDRVEPEHLSN